MSQDQPNNPLHGIKLEALLTELVDQHGWASLARAININCFKSDPSIKSSLKFLRRTPWARTKVEEYYLYTHKGLPRPGGQRQLKPKPKPKTPGSIWPKS
ncbi:MAG: VF530 family protein [Cellvibrionaceae bacterium]|nr:VF530 family protein [Cellvibrionaceae bacterium]MCV6624740.1 VF530 family protein [Cellvibrionaceae bacterium]